jgi:uroporphyrinogen-III synthase
VPDLVASEPNGATLAREMPVPAGVVLLARSDRALPDLPRLLRARGAIVREIVAYHTDRPAPADADRAREALAHGAPIVCLASPSAVDGFVDLVGDDLARAARPVAIGPTTAEHVRRRLGREPAVVAALEPEAVVRAVSELTAEVVHGGHH